MVSEMVLPPERLVAHVARVGPLVGVRPFVNEQVVALRELPLAKLADELLPRPRRRALTLIRRTRIVLLSRFFREHFVVGEVTCVVFGGDGSGDKRRDEPERRRRERERRGERGAEVGRRGRRGSDGVEGRRRPP